MEYNLVMQTGKKRAESKRDFVIIIENVNFSEFLSVKGVETNERLSFVFYVNKSSLDMLYNISVNKPIWFKESHTKLLKNPNKLVLYDIKNRLLFAFYTSNKLVLEKLYSGNFKEFIKDIATHVKKIYVVRYYLLEHSTCKWLPRDRVSFQGIELDLMDKGFSFRSEVPITLMKESGWVEKHKIDVKHTSDSESVYIVNKEIITNYFVNLDEIRDIIRIRSIDSVDEIHKLLNRVGVYFKDKKYEVEPYQFMDNIYLNSRIRSSLHYSLLKALIDNEISSYEIPKSLMIEFEFDDSSKSVPAKYIESAEIKGTIQGNQMIIKIIRQKEVRIYESIVKKLEKGVSIIGTVFSAEYPPLASCYKMPTKTIIRLIMWFLLINRKFKFKITRSMNREIFTRFLLNFLATFDKSLVTDLKLLILRNGKNTI